MTGGMTNANMLLMGQQSAMSVEVFMGGRDIFRYLLERRGRVVGPAMQLKVGLLNTKVYHARAYDWLVEYCNW